ncbi:MAG: CHRD domain-containing protein [Deltaproteobacteria bacterium]|nr:MAG: CHRD domain-containing protein [Deltaproteobacteria bacterium]
MKTNRSLAVVAVIASVALAADAKKSARNFATTLTAFEEVPGTISDGFGTLGLTIAPDDSRIDYTLSYTGLSGPALFSHIHFAEEDVNGAVMVFLCGGGGQKPCPGASGTVSGTIVAANVGANAAAQGVTPGDLAAVISVIRHGSGYANVHSPKYPGGEIRGQLKPGDDD